MAKVLCLRPLSDFADVGVSLPRGLNVVAMRPDDPGLAAAMQSHDALVIPAVGPKLSFRLFLDSTIRFIQVTGAGVDRLDIEALASMGIAVANAPGGSARAVAEYVLANASALLRFIPESTTAIRDGRYSEFRQAAIGRGLNQLCGLTLGIIGFGVIGRETAAQAKEQGAKVIFFDPVAEGGVSLDVLLRLSDIVTLHVPLTEGTRDLIGSAEIASMKKGAILINAARGGVVDEVALANALTSGHLGGAAVDVFSTEPPSPDNPLLNLSATVACRLILTPHIAGVTRQAWAELFRQAWENVEHVLIKGEPPKNVVNKT